MRSFERSAGALRGGVEGPLRCLWLSGYDPRSPDSGLLAYSDGLSRAAASAGGIVVGLGLRRTDALPVGDGRILWHLVDSKRRGPLVGLLTPLPQMAASYATRAYRRRLHDALHERWDAVVIDHLQMGWVIDTVRSARSAGHVGCVLHVSHNHETSVRERAAVESGTSRLHRAVLRLDALKVRRLERAVVDAADVVTCITEEDRLRFASSGARGRLVVVLPGYDGPVQPARRIGPGVARRAVLLGNTLWRVKRENLLGFLLIADPLFKAAGAELVVAGPSSEDLIATLRPRLHATRFLGAVDDVASVLRTARVGIVAEPVGGGFKMKTLDYVFNRVPIAALHGSVAGLPLEPGIEMLSFASGADLARGVVDVIDDLPRLNALQERAFLRCENLFDWSQRGDRVMLELVACGHRAEQR
jgi:polysaccharide biosynthesis protein PslH